MGFGRDDRPREMHTATCGDCGNECQIQFEPKDGRPVYCNECFPNHRNQRRDQSRNTAFLGINFRKKGIRVRLQICLLV